MTDAPNDDRPQGLGRYVKVYSRVWTDERFRAFSDDGKLAWLAVLTHPAMTAVGAMRATLEGIAAELGWPIKRLRAALKSALMHGMLELNESARYISLPNFLKYNRPESPNVCKAWVRAIVGLPECPELVRLVARCRVACDLRGLGAKEPKAWREAFEQAFAKAFPQGFSEALPEDIREPVAGTGTAGTAGEASPPTPSSSDAPTNGHRPDGVTVDEVPFIFEAR